MVSDSTPELDEQRRAPPAGVTLVGGCCRFVQHPVRGAAAAIAEASWGTQQGLLHVAALQQPLHSALPLQPHFELQNWRTAAFDLANTLAYDSPGEFAGATSLP